MMPLVDASTSPLGSARWASHGLPPGAVGDWLFRYLTSAGIRAHFRPMPHESSFYAMVYKHMPGEPHSPSLPLHLRQRCLGLRQPEGHIHVAVQRDGASQLGAGLLPLAGHSV
jgi:hypothetical protein